MHLALAAHPLPRASTNDHGGTPDLKETLRIAWERWKIIGEVYGDFQGRLFAVLFYFTVFIPFALGVRLLSDPLHLRKPVRRWLDRGPVGHTLDDARRQF